MASYPTFDNRWFSQDISGDKFDELFEPHRRPEQRPGPAGVPLDPDQVVAHQPGHPGPLQPGLGVQAVRRLVGDARRTDRPPTTYDDDGGSTRRASIDARRLRAPASSARGATRSARHQRARAATARINVSCRWPCRATCSSTGSARSSSPRPGPTTSCCRTSSSSSASAPTPASTCPTSATAGCPTTRTRPTSSRAGSLAEGEEPELSPRRRHQPGDRPGPARRHADAARRRLLGASPTAAT